MRFFIRLQKTQKIYLQSIFHDKSKLLQKGINFDPKEKSGELPFTGLPEISALHMVFVSNKNYLSMGLLVVI
tara:strand:+ start:502 stop:717 length:216 start_codon:yes stop_codon:yes gene_type:complete